VLGGECYVKLKSWLIEHGTLLPLPKRIVLRMMSPLPLLYTEQVQKRRTFAIISHPDAGKTTLTEKFLLYGGAVNLAGSVSAKKQRRAVTSDWMEIERQRGISISSTVLNFDYDGYVINLLDTPGHKDFSEDTYRTLMAADSVIMLIDNAKGVETQTRKLFQVCKRRNVPVVTFINKMDREGKEPLELLDQIEQEFGIATCAFNWPIGMGRDFKGLYDRRSNQVHLFERTDHGAHKAPVSVSDVNDPGLEALIGKQAYEQLREELSILDGAGNPFDKIAYENGTLSPVFFGSAANNFGIELFLNGFLPLAPAPLARTCELTGEIAPEAEQFSGFVFKIQANMDPLHRDCVAFMRICSGEFTRDMTVKHGRTGKTMRLSHAHKLFGQDRETSDTAYAGDIIGFSSNQGLLGIGDTVCTGSTVRFEAVPRFSPEQFALLKNPNPSKYKSFTKGIAQLASEGAIQLLSITDSLRQKSLMLGAVGQLQFDVILYRLKAEYGVEATLEFMPEYTHARWLAGSPEDLASIIWTSSTRFAEDGQGRPMALFKGEWVLNTMKEKYPKIQLLDLPPAG
jgi:peptide chain release factor 3